LKKRSSSIVILLSEHKSSANSGEFSSNLQELQSFSFDEFEIPLLDTFQERVFNDMASKAIVFNKEVQNLYSSSKKTRDVIEKHLYGSGNNKLVRRSFLTTTYYVEAKDIASWILRTYQFAGYEDEDSCRMRTYQVQFGRYNIIIV
jgi:hypothetical protein